MSKRIQTALALTSNCNNNSNKPNVRLCDALHQTNTMMFSRKSRAACNVISDLSFHKME